MTEINKLKSIELFAGIGGFRLGMKAANLDTIWGNDISELCCQVYQSNLNRAWQQLWLVVLTLHATSLQGYNFFMWFIEETGFMEGKY